MRKQSSITLGLAVLGLLLLSTMVLAASPLSSNVAKPDFRLLNGAFDEQWDGDVPLHWQVYRGDADDYGAYPIPISDATNKVANYAFFFQIENNEHKSEHNAYLYQELTLPPDEYSLKAERTVIYGANANFDESGSAVTVDTYTYMAYYALVPQADVMLGGSFMPELVSDGDWRELWEKSTVCSDKAKSVCDAFGRAETVTADAKDGKYVFILRAQIKWDYWRASAQYVFDDLHIILASSLPKDNGNVDLETLEGEVKP